MGTADRDIPVFTPWLARSARAYVLECLDTGMLSSIGSFVPRFEKSFSAFCRTAHGVAVTNGTHALHLALAAANIGPGDEVIVPALSFVATANAVTYTGARPVFADVDATTWTLDPADVERRLTPRTRALIPVHLYGHPADMDPLLEIAAARSLIVIEDAAEAHGALYKGRPVGSIGHVGCFSFYGNKIISTGEGGMLVTNDRRLAERSAFLRDQAMLTEPHYYHSAVGFNYRMTNLQAAVGCAQLEDIETILARKRDVAMHYSARLQGASGLSLPVEASWATSVYWMYSVLVEPGFGRDREAIRKGLKARGIDTRPFFVPLHLLPPYATGERHPVTEDVAPRGINLPSGPTLVEADIARVCDALLTDAP